MATGVLAAKSTIRPAVQILLESVLRALATDEARSIGE